MSTYDPAAEYARRLEARRETVAQMNRADSRLANLRLLVFLAAVAVGVGALYTRDFSFAWVLLPLVVFVGLMARHARVLQAKERAESAVRHYEQALERLAGHWAGKGRSGKEFAPEEHLYATDLDLFGEGSLFELLCAARTGAGESTLARWLMEPAPPEEIRLRQEAVEELRHKLDLREDLALLGTDVRGAIRPDVLAEWAVGPTLLRPRPWRPAAYAVAAATLGSLVLAAATGSAGPFMLMLIVSLVFSSLAKKAVLRIDQTVQEPGRELNVLAGVLERLEDEAFHAPRLLELRKALQAGHSGASRRIRQLDRLIDLLEARHNFLFGPVAFLLQWGVQIGLRIEDWRKGWGRDVHRWLAAVGELEALSSLAAFAYEHPADPFPEFVEGTPLFEAKGLGHPLLPERVVVRNDLRLDGDLRLMVVSGSNMSGKSTLLRTVGANTVLAQAGGPVRAESLRLSPLSLGATIRVQDSILRGTSRFYAEILRLKAMLDTAREKPPLLFLLDEILHGTNSHDRKIGADAIVKGLLEAGAIGLVTTHDLAVTRVVETLPGRAVNVHFTDRVEDGRLVFDYKLREGVVTEGNALRLMRIMGLPL